MQTSEKGAVCARARRSVAVAGLVGALFLSSATVASATGELGNETGGDVLQGTYVQSASEAQQSSDKMAVAMAGYDASQGLSAQTYRSLLTQYAATWGKDSVSPREQQTIDNGVSSELLAPTSWTLAMNHSGQINNYYCGPASGYMILRASGKTVSAKNGASLTQSALGASTHMNTDIGHVTSWGTAAWRKGMNRWRNNADTGFYIDRPNPGAAQLKVILVQDIGAAQTGFGLSTVEYQYGAHYNGHPNRTIGHWIAAYGYTSSGATGKYMDSSTTVFPGASATFSYPTTSFASFVSTNGVTW